MRLQKSRVPVERLGAVVSPALGAVTGFFRRRIVGQVSGGERWRRRLGGTLAAGASGCENRPRNGERCITTTEDTTEEGSR